MANQTTEEELVLEIGSQVESRPDLDVDDLLDALIGNNDPSDVPKVLRAFITKEFTRQSKNVCRQSTKSFLAQNLQYGSSDLIRKFTKAAKDDDFIDAFPADIKTRLEILKKNDALGSLLVECVRVFNRLREKYSPAQSEDQLRYFLAEWFQSGLMPLSIWSVFRNWNQSGATLAKLRSLPEPAGAQTDTKWREFRRLLKNVKTDEFVDANKLKTILNIFFQTPQISVAKGRVKLIGRVLFLSEWMSQIESSLKNAAEVEILAEDSLGIDCNLTGTVWQGKNLIIVSQCVHVWREAKIRLSGESFAPNKRKATNASSAKYRGADGQDGRPGESSGNLVILTTRLVNAEKLTAELSGGRGEDGEDGGDGYDGVEGVGVTRNDIDQLVLSYSSLYRDSWSNFHNYSPPSNWIVQTNKSSSGEYVHRTYKDENNRVMTYSFAADKGVFYTTYELYFLIRGSNGTSGTSGGSNGVGGQGGYNGRHCVFKIRVVERCNQFSVYDIVIFKI
jgi:hypothetical protein